MQTLVTSNITKTTKKLRKAILRNLLLSNGKINRVDLLDKFQCSDRALRNDMNEVAAEIEAEQANKMKILRGICIDKLTIKAASDELDESTLSKIVTCGETRKVEVKEEITETKTVNINVKSMLAEYEHLFAASRTEKESISRNSPAEQVYSSQAHPEASAIPIT